MKTLIIVPVKDEADALPVVLPHLQRHINGHHVLVVDNGSTDGTAAVADELGYVVLGVPHGEKPAAVKAAFELAVVARYEAVVVFDGDGQHPPEAVEPMLNWLDREPARIIKGSRFMHPPPPEVPSERVLLNSRTRRALSRWSQLTDPQCGLVAMTTKTAQGLLPALDWKSQWEMEMLLWFAREGRDVVREYAIPAIYTGLPGAKQAAKYADTPAAHADRAARVERHLNFIQNTARRLGLL